MESASQQIARLTRERDERDERIEKLEHRIGMLGFYLGLVLDDLEKTREQRPAERNARTYLYGEVAAWRRVA